MRIGVLMVALLISGCMSPGDDPGRSGSAPVDGAGPCPGEWDPSHWVALQAPAGPGGSADVFEVRVGDFFEDELLGADYVVEIMFLYRGVESANVTSHFAWGMHPDRNGELEVGFGHVLAPMVGVSGGPGLPVASGADPVSPPAVRWGRHVVVNSIDDADDVVYVATGGDAPQPGEFTVGLTAIAFHNETWWNDPAGVASLAKQFDCWVATGKVSGPAPIASVDGFSVGYYLESWRPTSTGEGFGTRLWTHSLTVRDEEDALHDGLLVDRTMTVSGSHEADSSWAFLSITAGRDVGHLASYDLDAHLPKQDLQRVDGVHPRALPCELDGCPDSAATSYNAFMMAEGAGSSSFTFTEEATGALVEWHSVRILYVAIGSTWEDLVGIPSQHVARAALG